MDGLLKLAAPEAVQVQRRSTREHGASAAEQKRRAGALPRRDRTRLGADDARQDPLPPSAAAAFDGGAHEEADTAQLGVRDEAVLLDEQGLEGRCVIGTSPRHPTMLGQARHPAAVGERICGRQTPVHSG